MFLLGARSFLFAFSVSCNNIVVVRFAASSTAYKQVSEVEDEGARFMCGVAFASLLLASPRSTSLVTDLAGVTKYFQKVMNGFTPEKLPTYIKGLYKEAHVTHESNAAATATSGAAAAAEEPQPHAEVAPANAPSQTQKSAAAAAALKKRRLNKKVSSS